MSDAFRRAGKLSERLLIFGLVPVVTLAVLLLGAAALRTTLQVEKASTQAVFDATWSLAEERVDRLDKAIIAQDNAVAANVRLSDIGGIGDRWMLTAVRETPTVRAVLVLDLGHPDREVRSFVSRRPGPEDDELRRLLIHRMIPLLDLTTAPVEQLRHLHHAIGDRSFLLSYWQRESGGRRYLVVAWHSVPQLVHDMMPRLYRDLDRSSRMNVIDQQGRILFGPPLRAGRMTVGLRFPTTLYNWSLQVTLTSAGGLVQRAVRQRYVQLAVVGLAMLIAVFGLVIIVRASLQERRLAGLKSDFVANVSHELKTPLASVRMFGEMLLSGRVPSPAKGRQYLEIIVGESERLSSLIDNVLDFAKVEKGKDAYDFADGDLAAIAGRVADMQSYRAKQLGIELALQLEPARAWVDARAVELALINLIDNALKYAKESKSIELGVAASAEGGGATVWVADDGPGIDQEDRARIFDRFVRGHRARDAHVRGSGIGLALVKHIMDNHGGTVNVVSPRPGGRRGAIFELSFPPAGDRAAPTDGAPGGQAV